MGARIVLEHITEETRMEIARRLIQRLRLNKRLVLVGQCRDGTIDLEVRSERAF